MTNSSLGITSKVHFSYASTQLIKKNEPTTFPFWGLFVGCCKKMAFWTSDFVRRRGWISEAGWRRLSELRRLGGLERQPGQLGCWGSRGPHPLHQGSRVCPGNETSRTSAESLQKGQFDFRFVVQGWDQIFVDPGGAMVVSQWHRKIKNAYLKFVRQVILRWHASPVVWDYRFLWNRSKLDP